MLQPAMKWKEIFACPAGLDGMGTAHVDLGGRNGPDRTGLDGIWALAEARDATQWHKKSGTGVD